MIDRVIFFIGTKFSKYDYDRFGFEIIQKSGTWFSCKEERMGQGREAAKNYLKQTKKLANSVEKEVVDKIQKMKETTKKGS